MASTSNQPLRARRPRSSVSSMAIAFSKSTERTRAIGAANKFRRTFAAGLGEPVTIKVERAGSEAPLYFTIVRDAVPLPTIRNAYMIRPGTGYIGLTGGFQRSSDDELAKAMKRLEEQGMRQLILDLRGNPGGLLDQAIDVASEFLPRGQVVVSVKGRTEYSEPIVYKVDRFRSGDCSACRTHQSQQCFGVRDRCGRDSGSRARSDRRRDEFWQRPGAAHIPVAFQYWTDAHNRALLHALRTLFATRLFEWFALRLLHAARSRPKARLRRSANRQRNIEVAAVSGLSNSTSAYRTGSADCRRACVLRWRRDNSGYRN